ncbi:HAD-IIA family hydrolase [Cohnella fermenti]|uniref:Acid sugar phosphatase n=2 Tax=Cohnella fermenti TaxID=2565925 RepID=A0A4S4BJ27_9BACL|nr:HAD-IIA family hydrolase [Cohnella fermenti]
MNKPQALLFDLDGTLYRGDERIPGADEMIATMYRQDMPCWFVTNNSTRTPSQVAEHLHTLGIPATTHQVITSAEAAAYYAGERFPGAAVCVIGEHGLQEAIREAGLVPAGDGRAELVIQGLDRQLTYAQLTEAVAHLLAGADYLLTNPDRQLPVAGGVLPGAGSIAAALQAAAGVEPTVIGKPSPILMNYALARAGVDAANAWVIGDNPRTDIAAGLEVGCKTVLVLTGLCTERDWRRRCEEAGAMPDAVCDGPAELTAWLTSL